MPKLASQEVKAFSAHQQAKHFQTTFQFYYSLPQEFQACIVLAWPNLVKQAQFFGSGCIVVLLVISKPYRVRTLIVYR